MSICYPPALRCDLTFLSSSALSFWLSSGPSDNALQWTTLTDAQRASIKADYAAAGISLVVSAFGSTDLPTSSQRDPTATAQAAAAFVKSMYSVALITFHTLISLQSTAWMVSMWITRI